jgi:hypothetical protein
MVNGKFATALLPPDLEPLTVSASTDSAPNSIETAIGVAVAGAAAVLAAGLFDYQQNGRLDPATREAAGSPLVRLAQLQLNYEFGDSDFVALARQAGRRELRRLCDCDISLFQRHTSAAVDAAVDFYIAGVLEIVGNAVRGERAIQAAWAS